MRDRGLGYSGGFYASSDDHDELAWAAVWLFTATGTQSYIDDIMAVSADGRYTGYLGKVVKTTQDKPGELKARVVDSHGGTVATTETLNDAAEPGTNQGLGQFTFTPKAGEKYELKIDEPAGVIAIAKFPEIKADGIAMSVPTGVTRSGESIQVIVTSADKARELLVGAYCRGRLLEHKRVHAEPNRPTTVELAPDDSMGGVVRVTVFEERGADPNRLEFIPRAERLVYRRSTKKLQFNIEPNQSRYAPGEAASLTVSATDEQGKPARAVLMMSVVNQSIITMADMKTDRSMTTHVAIAGEVRNGEDLEHADFLFNETNPKAAQTLDLLLGVQGWRRFLEQDPAKFRQEHQQEADREARRPARNHHTPPLRMGKRPVVRHPASPRSERTIRRVTRAARHRLLPPRRQRGCGRPAGAQQRQRQPVPGRRHRTPG